MVLEMCRKDCGPGGRKSTCLHIEEIKLISTASCEVSTEGSFECTLKATSTVALFNYSYRNFLKNR